MTPEQIIQHWRDISRHTTERPKLWMFNLDWALIVADAYEAQAQKLAEVEAENVKLRDWEDVRRQLERSTSPCGHRAQYAFTEDGGKHISCLVCVKAERDALKAKVDELEALVLPEPVSDAYTLSRKLLGRTLKGDQ